MKAFILSAGFGTRLQPFTNIHPKALAEINGKSLLEINIRNLQRFGIFDIVINVHHFANQIIELLEKENGFGSNYEISNESDAILETGGGLKKAQDFLKNDLDFLMINVDIISNINLSDLINHHQSTRALATLAVQNRKSSRYLLFNEKEELCGWENVKTEETKLPRLDSIGAEIYTQLAFSGIQVLSKTIFDKINFAGRFSIIDVYLDLCKQEKIIGWDHSNDILLDVGRPESLIAASEIINWL